MSSPSTSLGMTKPQVLRSNLDGSFKHELRRAGKRNIAKLPIDLFKSDPQFVPPACNYVNWTVHVFSGGKDQRTGDHAGAARQRFILYASFVSADSDLIGSASLNEVHVCTLWRKHFMMANGRAVPRHIDIADLCDWNNDMRHAAIYEMNDLFLSANLKRNTQSQIGRLGHLQSDEVSSQLRRNDASWSFKGNFATGACHLVCETREAARAIPAHFRFSSICIKVTHSEIGVVRRVFQQQNSVRSDTAVAITKVRDLNTS